MLHRALAVRLHLQYRSDTTLRVACREPTAYATVRPSNGVFCTPTALTGTGAPERALCGGECHAREHSSPPVRRHVARLAYQKLTMPPRCAEMYRERDVPRNVVRCLAMPREHKEDSSSRYRTLQGKKIFQNLPLSTRSFLATKGDLSPRYRTLREKKSSKTFHYLLVLFSLLALYGKLLREDGVFYRS